MSRWFRFHAEALDDPKVQRLDGDTFKAWVNLLCLASRNGGKLPPVEDIAFALRCDDNAARTVLERLLNATLIDKSNGGPNGYSYAPHGWAERQYKSDTSTERVKRFRKRSDTVTETPPDTDTEQSKTVAKATASEPNSDAAFWADAKAYLGQSRGSLINKWLRDNPKAEVAKAITAAQLERAVDPVAYITKTLSRSRSDERMPIA